MKLAILISVAAHLLAAAAIYYPHTKSSKGDKLDVRGLATIIKNYDPYSPFPMSKDIEDRRDEH